MITEDGRPREDKLDDEESIRLFFGALSRLGFYDTGWETWYGTRPLVVKDSAPLPSTIYHPADQQPR